MWQQVSWIMHTCTTGAQTAHSSIPCGMSSPEVRSASGADLCKNHFKKYHTVAVGGYRKKQSNTEVWQSSRYFKTSKLSKGQVHHNFISKESPACFPAGVAQLPTQTGGYFLLVLCCLLVVIPLEELYRKSFLATATDQWKWFLTKCSLNQMKKELGILLLLWKNGVLLTGRGGGVLSTKYNTSNIKSTGDTLDIMFPLQDSLLTVRHSLVQQHGNTSIHELLDCPVLVLL